MSADGFVTGWPRAILRVEGAALLLTALVSYSHIGRPWWVFALLFLVPDVSMLGYLAGPLTGSRLYNAVHTLTLPLGLLCVGLTLGADAITGTALIWLAHNGLDRMLGYGLKYGSSFNDTHLGRIGRRGRDAPPDTAGGLRMSP